MTTETQAEQVPYRGSFLYVVHFPPPSASKIEQLPKHLRSVAVENVRTTTLFYRAASLPIPGDTGRLLYERDVFEVFEFMRNVRDCLVRDIDDPDLASLLCGSKLIDGRRRGYECCYMSLIEAGESTTFEGQFTHDILGRYRRGYTEPTAYDWAVWSLAVEDARANGLPLPPKPKGG